MNDYRYILEPYSGRNSRFTCPNCEKPHQFTRYIDTETGEVIERNVGKCNRIDKCGYHYTPKQFFQDNNILPFSRGDAQRAEGFSSPAFKREDFLPFKGEVAHLSAKALAEAESAGGVISPNYINNIKSGF